MSLGVQTFLQLDLPAMLAALLATTACALLGNFLVLRRQSLMGDAISHAVLPGIVLGFLVAGTRATWPMLAGAALAGILAAILIELVRRYGRLDAGTAMGVVFASFFAAGVVLIERAALGAIDLDADCVLYGQLEDILWLAPSGWASLLEPAVWLAMPREVVTLAGTLAVVVAALRLFWKELVMTSFDPELADALGFRVRLVDLGLMVLVAAVAVAAFEAVGSILVIAMFICPAAAARLCTDRLHRQVALSVGAAVVAALGGYAAAVFLPPALGHDGALLASGMIATVSGLLLGVALLAAPRYGLMARRRRLRLAGASGTMELRA
jgi:manganese/zinc/iron transport system permease protein